MKRAPASFFLFAFSFLVYSGNARSSTFKNFNSTASLSTTWTIHYPGSFNSDMIFQPILIKETHGSIFGCGFYYDYVATKYDSFLFAIYIINRFDSTNDFFSDPVVVWSANRDNPVRNGAKLNFTAAGDLVLLDFDGDIIWTTNTSGKSVTGMNLTDTGNLVLFDVHNSVVWQSFDHPTDCLLLGQSLATGQKLIPSVSNTNLRAQQGLFSLQFTTDGTLGAYVGSNPPQLYYRLLGPTSTSKEGMRVTFMNGSLQLFQASVSLGPLYTYIPNASSTQYMKLMPDGHLQVLEWLEYEWKVIGNVLEIYDWCHYPLACGRNALCTADQQCTCPSSDYFRAVNQKRPNQGCSEITPLTCNATELQEFITLKDVAYFNHHADMEKVNMETCKQACLNNCSCKAAFFRYGDGYGSNSSSGKCYLPSELFTMIYVVDTDYTLASAFIKVQNLSSSLPSSKRKNKVATIEASTIGSFVFLIVIVAVFITFIAYKRKRNSETDEEYLDQVPGLPNRFSYHALKTSTENFSKKLGEGGFGSVFEGTLEDGSKIAVKRLEGLAHVNKSFLAEVESIGSIHHVNLVRLIGFCAWNSQRHLVYEFMSNGSLDRWIYHGDRRLVLTWECRKKIIFDIAKGLAYLHEECRQKIIHLDIKPQNILLDNDFNAKVSDFGLSKLIDKNQSHVTITMRGTPGYMAPEWLSSIITEKVDVYSFGIVLLEILCGRKNFDRCEPEESWHLLGVFQKCWEQEKLLDLVDKHSEDMQAHGVEVVEMMKVASWCLQTDYTRRPSMSTVIKVLEGAMNVEVSLDYNLSDPRLHKCTVESKKDSTPLLPSVLSRPR